MLRMRGRGGEQCSRKDTAVIKLDYYFTLISPFSYMGHRPLRAMLQSFDVELAYKPVRLAKIFEATGGQPPAKRHPNRQAWRLAELKRWSTRLESPLNLQPKYFPTDDSLANGVVAVIGQKDSELAGDLAQEFHELVWLQDLDLSDSARVAAVLTNHGLDAEAVLAQSREEGAALLDANTQEAIERGVFGAPSYCIGDELFWGQDRLDFLHEALQRASSNALARQLSAP